MKFFNLIGKLAILMCGILLWTVPANAYYQGPSELGLDGSGTSVIAWRILDTNKYKLQAAYGTGVWVAIDITSIGTEEVIDYPILAISKDPSATIRAAVIWLSKDVANPALRNLRVSVYNSTSGTWSAPTTISSGLTTETVRADYLVVMSDDGQTISVTWTALIGTSNFLRSAISINGGGAWTTTTVVNLGSVFSISSE